jgi:hypothetical protein
MTGSLLNVMCSPMVRGMESPKTRQVVTHAEKRPQLTPLRVHRKSHRVVGVTQPWC